MMRGLEYTRVLLGLSLGCAVIGACASSDEDDGLYEDVESLGQSLRKPLGVNGDSDYCNNPANLCVAGEGDCDSHAQCTTAYCGRDNGPLFGFEAGSDVCVPQTCQNKRRDGTETQIDCGGLCGTVCPNTCTLPNGDPNRCSVDCLCSSGQGDCDSNAQCQTGLICGSNNGSKFGFTGQDFCVPSTCQNGRRDGNETQIDCGGSCGTICAAPVCNRLNGDPNRCSTDCLCSSGQGDCDAANECQSGLVCASNNGVQFGFTGQDMCVPSHCTNGVQDGNETQVDCGGSCGAICGGVGGTTFLGLGDLAGGAAASYATGVTSDGGVVIGKGTSAGGTEAFRWDPVSGMTALGDLPGGTFNSIAYGLSDNGTTVVGTSNSTNGVEAFSWTSAGGIAGLGDIAGGTFRSEARGVSSNGAVIIGQGRSAEATEAFRYTGGAFTLLGDLVGGVRFSQAWSTNGAGTVIVGRSRSTNGSEAFRWIGGTMLGLGDLAGGAFASVATAVNTDGSVVVGNGTGAAGTQAFRWTSGGMVGLGVLPGTTTSYAYDVSDDGSVVVGSAYDGVTATAFVWTSTGGLRSLQSALTTAGLNLTGWNLQVASGVSANGRVFVGYGTNPSGNIEAFRAQVPSL